MLAPRALRPLITASALVLVGLATASCGGAAPSGAAGVVTSIDTTPAGTPWIRNAGRAPLLELRRLYGLGAVGGLGAASPDEFGDIRGVVADAAGRVYVADGMAHEIRVFAPDGRFLRRLGGKGSGPGEIGGLTAMAWAGPDTLVVLDNANARITLLTASGDHAGQWPWARFSGSVRFLHRAGPREFYAWVPRPRRSGEGRIQSVWARFASGVAMDSLEIPVRDAPEPGSGVLCRGGGGLGMFGNPEAEKLIAVPAPGGERILASSSAYRLAFIDPGGDTLRVVSREAEPPPLTDERWAPVDSAYRAFMAQWRAAECEGDIQRPATAPILRDVYFDHEGRLLVEHEGASGRALDLYDDEWRWRGTLPLPPKAASPAPFLRDRRLYIVVADTLGVERVEVYALASDI